MSRPVSREQALKNEFGFELEEEKTGGGGDIGSVEQSVSRINRVDDDDDAAADEEELERLAEQVQAAREAQMVSIPNTSPARSNEPQPHLVAADLCVLAHSPLVRHFCLLNVYSVPRRVRGERRSALKSCSG